MCKIVSKIKLEPHEVCKSVQLSGVFYPEPFRWTSQGTPLPDSRHSHGQLLDPPLACAQRGGIKPVHFINIAHGIRLVRAKKLDNFSLVGAFGAWKEPAADNSYKKTAWVLPTLLKGATKPQNMFSNFRKFAL